VREPDPTWCRDTLASLDRGAAKEHLDLLKFAAGRTAELRAMPNPGLCRIRPPAALGQGQAQRMIRHNLEWPGWSSLWMHTFVDPDLLDRLSYLKRIEQEGFLPSVVPMQLYAIARFSNWLHAGSARSPL
jgi:hypothetical protein